MAKEETSSPSFVEEAQDTLKQVVSDRLLLVKMETAEKTAMLVSKLAFAFAAAFLAFFILLFLSLMAGYYFSQLFESQFIGFGIIAGFYALVLLLLIVFGRKPLSEAVSNNIIGTFFKEETLPDPDDDDDIETLTRKLKQKLEQHGQTL